LRLPEAQALCQEQSLCQDCSASRLLCSCSVPRLLCAETAVRQEQSLCQDCPMPRLPYARTALCRAYLRPRLQAKPAWGSGSMGTLPATMLARPPFWSHSHAHQAERTNCARSVALSCSPRYSKSAAPASCAPAAAPSLGT